VRLPHSNPESLAGVSESLAGVPERMRATGLTQDAPIPATPWLSLVIPVLDEGESIGELYQQIHEVLEETALESEIIFVDDGSRDNTSEVLEDLFRSDARVRVLGLRRNFGKTAALLAGFEEARGDVIITLDGDLQDDPREIPRFVSAIRGDLDLVSGWKRNRRDPPTKTLPSRIFNFTVRRMTRIPLHDFNCGFKAYRREVLQELKLYGELHRFIPVLAYWRGYRVGELSVEHRPRKFGRSKFGAGRLLKGMLDFIKVLFLTRYLQRPLQLFGLFGLGLLGIGAAGFLYLLVLKLMGQSLFQTHGPLLFLCGILIVTGLQLFMLGLVGEMLRHYSFHPDDEYSVRRRLSRD
jgi:glycosyltransferase involved in cell wall biosynthesis